MGEKIVVCGEAGQGQAVKVISQAITAINCATLAQGLLVARQVGVDVEKLLETMDGGSSDSTMRALKGRPMLEHDFSPLFKLAHMLKDVQLCLGEARTAGASFPFAGLAAELYGAGMGRGLGEQDFASGARGRRGPGRRPVVSVLARRRSSPECGGFRMNMSICRQILRIRDFVHSM